MNTKKAIWVKRPKTYITIDLHSFSWDVDDSSSVIWTIGEVGVIDLRAVYDDSVSLDFVLLHTPNDYVRFTNFDKLLLKIENPAFLGSASFGFEVKGKGKVKLSVF